MNVFINNKPYPFNPSEFLSDVLKSNNFIQLKGIAVAVNNVVIQKSNWGNYQLNENDKITIITATQGG